MHDGDDGVTIMVLEVPPGHSHGDLILLKRVWMTEMLRTSSVPAWESPLPPAEAEAIIRERSAPDGGQWIILETVRTKRKDTKVQPVVPIRKSRPPDLSFAETLSAVSQDNLDNLWRENYRAREGEVQQQEQPDGVEHDRLVLSLLSRLHPETEVIFHRCHAIETFPERRRPLTVRHILHPMTVVADEDEIVALYPHRPHTLLHAVRFTPSFLGGGNLRPLFVLYQMLSALDTITGLGLDPTDITLDDFKVDDRFLVQLRPRVGNSIVECPTKDDDMQTSTSHSLSKELSDSLQQTLSLQSPDQHSLIRNDQ